MAHDEKRLGSGLARSLAACVLGGMVLVLGGSVFHVRAVIAMHDGLQGMSPVTAVTLLLLASSICLKDNASKTDLLAGLAIALGGLVLSSYALTGSDAVSSFLSLRVFGFDLQRSGLTSPATALGMTAVGVSVITRDRPRINDLSGAIALVLAGFALLGYGYGVRDLYDVLLLRTMAIHTALAIFALGVAALAMNPTVGWAAVITARSDSGVATRRLLAFTLLIPVAGWVLLQATDVHRLGSAAAMAFLVVFTVVPLCILIVKNGNAAAAIARERRAKVDALRAGDLELRRIADALPVLIAFVDRDYIYRFANKTYQDWFDRPAEYVIGRKISELLDARNFENRRPHLESALAGREARFELSWPHSDGREREAEIRYIPRRQLDGEVDGFHIFVTEITDRKRLERELLNRATLLKEEVEQRTKDLRISQAKASLYFRSSVEYLYLISVDAAGQVVFADVNPATERVFKRSAAEIIGHSVREFMPAAAVRDIEFYALRCCETGQSQTYQARRQYADREVVIDALVSLLEAFNGGGGLVLFSGRDVTEQLAVQEQLRQAQKMEAVGQLTGGLAHDFNNLLAGISGSLELMQVRLQQGRFNDVDRYMAAAQGASKRAAALTHRLLAFSRRQTLDPKPTNVNRLVSGMQEMIQRTVGPGIPIEVVGATGLWPALVDGSQLENALLNLCINARDAMPNGGRITIETANKWLDDRAARQHDVPEGQYLALCVTDTGTGMPPEVIARVFEPFFTTKPIGEGTGLGLSMIYGFTQQSGGQVRIYSELGKGTTVCLYLPRHLWRDWRVTTNSK